MAAPRTGTVLPAFYLLVPFIVKAVLRYSPVSSRPPVRVKSAFSGRAGRILHKVLRDNSSPLDLPLSQFPQRLSTATAARVV
ncbi:hypothetical protein BDZ89DRAFT_1056790 [Hymenopellis radicata]|nr:hypothetical protein BDZ89DRAFT_1056790 [Hymenopellis radicata]